MHGGTHLEPIRRLALVAILVTIAWLSAPAGAQVAPPITGLTSASAGAPAAETPVARTGTPVEKLGRVASTGPHIPVNGRPTVVFVDAIWCPFCALARSELQAVRPDYEGQINFIVLDYDLPEDLRLARALGIAGHPTFAILPPGSDGTEVSDRRFGPLPRATLRAAFDQALGS